MLKNITSAILIVFMFIIITLSFTFKNPGKKGNPNLFSKILLSALHIKKKLLGKLIKNKNVIIIINEHMIPRHQIKYPRFSLQKRNTTVWLAPNKYGRNSCKNCDVMCFDDVCRIVDILIFFYHSFHGSFFFYSIVSNALLSRLCGLDHVISYLSPVGSVTRFTQFVCFCVLTEMDPVD